MKDPFSVLGLGPGATEEDVKRAYRRLAKRYHPDVRGGNAEAGPGMSELNAAYRELMDNPGLWFRKEDESEAAKTAATLREKTAERRRQAKAREEEAEAKTRRDGHRSLIRKAAWLLLWIAITLLSCLLIALIIRGVRALSATDGFKSFKEALPSEETTLSFLEKILRLSGSLIGAFLSFLRSMAARILP